MWGWGLKKQTKKNNVVSQEIRNGVKTATLTDVQQTVIDHLYKEGKPQGVIAKEASCSQSAIFHELLENWVDSKSLDKEQNGPESCCLRFCRHIQSVLFNQIQSKCGCLPGKVRPLHAFLCWQTLRTCWSHYPPELGTCSTLKRTKTCFNNNQAMLWLIGSRRKKKVTRAKNVGELKAAISHLRSPNQLLRAKAVQFMDVLWSCLTFFKMKMSFSWFYVTM